MHHSELAHPEKEVALELMNSKFQKGQDALRRANHLILTFGSSKAFHLKEDNSVVANCHKYPSDHFYAIRTPLDLLITEAKLAIDLILQVNPTINILFTVSPIRHIRDGLIENNRSKARLLLLCETLSEHYSFCQYFPAYELLMDDLRDYRYFEKDMVHPSEMAQAYIWNYFLKNNFNEAIYQVEKKVGKIIQARTHKPSFPESAAHQAFLNKTQEQLAVVKKEYPFLNLEHLLF